MDYRALLIAPLAALVLSVSAASPLPLPEGWIADGDLVPLNGRPSEGYEIGIDTTVPGSTPCLTVHTIAAQPKDDRPKIGHAYQSVTGYAGQRVRFSGQVRAVGTSPWAGLYLGLGLGMGDGDVLAPVTMGQAGVEHHLPAGAAVPADGQWHEVSVVLDVPAEQPFLSLGVAQVGEGQVWVRKLQFEVVGRDVPATTTPIGIDWAQAQRTAAAARETVAKLPPQPLQNAALD
jgi:hypothetical protein